MERELNSLRIEDSMKNCDMHVVEVMIAVKIAKVLFDVDVMRTVAQFDVRFDRFHRF